MREWIELPDHDVAHVLVGFVGGGITTICGRRLNCEPGTVTPAEQSTPRCARCGELMLTDYYDEPVAPAQPTREQQ